MKISNNEYRKKLKRYNVPNHARELTFSCYKKYSYFSDPIACEIFLKHLVSVREIYQFELWAYVIMPDHVHLLIWPGKNGEMIPEVLHRLKGRTSKDYGTHIKIHCPQDYDSYCVNTQKKKHFKFWQSGGGFDRNLWNAKPVHNSIEYIEGNPVKAGMVDEPEKWPWSSAWARKHQKGLVPDDKNIPTLMGS